MATRVNFPNFGTGTLLLLNISPGFSSTYSSLSLTVQRRNFCPSICFILAQKGEFFICQKLAAALPVTIVSYYWSTWVALVSFKGLTPVSYQVPSGVPYVNAWYQYWVKT
jgi:hypothetical protein